MEVESFLDSIAQGVMVFREGVKHYLGDNDEAFKDNLKTISDHEGEADRLRRNTRQQLYNKMLIPESRGDVLGLLENMDNVIDRAKETLLQFDVEQPQITEELDDEFMELVDLSVKAVESLVMAARAFFVNVSEVNNYINQVMFYEKEVDKAEDRLIRKIFDMDRGLSHKMHLRDFVTHIGGLSDEAEEVCERLSVYAIKRSF
jgi:hypothetical protein